MNAKEKTLRDEFEIEMAGYKLQRDVEGCYIAPLVEEAWQLRKKAQVKPSTKGEDHALAQA
jgi:hypothetical protein